MTGSTLTLTPKPTAGLGVGANTEPRPWREQRGAVDKIDTYEPVA
jgi:hypothetical protein